MQFLCTSTNWQTTDSSPFCDPHACTKWERREEAKPLLGWCQGITEEFPKLAINIVLPDCDVIQTSLWQPIAFFPQQSTITVPEYVIDYRIQIILLFSLKNLPWEGPTLARFSPSRPIWFLNGCVIQISRKWGLCKTFCNHLTLPPGVLLWRRIYWYQALIVKVLKFCVQFACNLRTHIQVFV